MLVFNLFTSYGMTGLFAIGLISSILPVPTEPVVFGLVDIGKNPLVILSILIAGSIIGATLGYLIGKYELRKIIPFHDREKEKKMQMYFRKYGATLLLVSPWIPFIGDLAPMVAGIENYNLSRFLAVITMSKIIKGIGIVYASLIMNGW